MEKRNVIEPCRTPCKKGSSDCCDCPDCRKLSGQKKAADRPVSINDIEALAKVHK